MFRLTLYRIVFQNYMTVYSPLFQVLI